MPSPTIDRIARKSVPIQVPQFPSKAAIASAAQRKDLVAIGAAEDFQNEEWRKKLQLALETAIASALLSLSSTSTGTGADGATGPQGERGATGPQGPQGVAGADGVSGLFAIEEGSAWAVYAGITPLEEGDASSVYTGIEGIDEGGA
jgi:hypothetical protein